MFFSRDTAYLGYHGDKRERRVIDLLFFGRMADVAGARHGQVAAAESLLALRDQVFATALKDGVVTVRDIRMSVNQVVVTGDQPLTAGDEVAFFSVFSGG